MTDPARRTPAAGAPRPLLLPAPSTADSPKTSGPRMQHVGHLGGDCAGPCQTPSKFTCRAAEPVAPTQLVPRRDPKPLARDILSSLERYHNVDGAGNGSPFTGLQLGPGLGDKAALERSLSAIADYVAAHPAVLHLPAPSDDKARDAQRKVLAKAWAAKAEHQPVQQLTALLDRIADPQIKKRTAEAIAKAPPEFWLAPSSSTGKHHPADEINVGGLALHTRRVVVMGEILCDFYGVTGRARDCVLAGLLVHDMQKGGQPWKGYAADHGPIASRWLREIWGRPSDKDTRIIRVLAGKHMAQWNKPKAQPPRTLLNQIVSYADYIASQDTVYVTA